MGMYLKSPVILQAIEGAYIHVLGSKGGVNREKDCCGAVLSLSGRPVDPGIYIAILCNSHLGYSVLTAYLITHRFYADMSDLYMPVAWFFDRTHL